MNNKFERIKSKFKVTTDYKNGVIYVMNIETYERVVIPYRIKMEGNGSFVSNLKTLRKIKGLSQRKLSEVSGIPYKTIVNYENSVRIPNGRNLCILASYFGIDAESLLGTDINDNKEEER